MKAVNTYSVIVLNVIDHLLHVKHAVLQDVIHGNCLLDP